jgi:hypothetical protein
MGDRTLARGPEMDGFAAEWADPTDYILGITRHIWEDRNIGSLNHDYTSDVIVRSPDGIVCGNRAVIAATIATLAEFPDRTLLGEDVIWCPDPDGGFLSSHRILSTATHRYDGALGQATGKRLRYRVIADCAARSGQIHDEWLIRDQAAIVRQMGWEPKFYAADRIAREGGPDVCARPLTPAEDVVGRYRGAGNDHPIAVGYGEVLTRIVNADFAVIRNSHSRAVQLELPGGVTDHGCEPLDEFWLGLRGAFPSAAFQIHHRIGRDDPAMPPRAAIRWSLMGKHDGWGMFGAPSGANVHVMGITHVEFGPTGVRRVFFLLDTIAVWKQILLHTG